MPCNKIHKFEIILLCVTCNRKEIGTRQTPCKAENGIEVKRVGCVQCNTSLLMWFFCDSGRMDKEEMFPLKITTKNLS
jgi:hypothetical protein